MTDGSPDIPPNPDLALAREIHKTMIEDRRNKKLAVIETELETARRGGNAAGVTALEAQRERLRLLPGSLPIDQQTTVDDIRSLWSKDLD